MHRKGKRYDRNGDKNVSRVKNVLEPILHSKVPTLIGFFSKLDIKMNTFWLLIGLVSLAGANGAARRADSNNLQDIDNEGPITKKYQPIADQIRNFLLSGNGKGETYRRLANFSDKFGVRVATSSAYQQAAQFLISQLEAAGVDRVTTETVEGLPLWSRGEPNPGRAFLLEPRNKLIPILALDNSTATPAGGITAEAIAVTSFDELAALPAEKVKGRIVVYNQPWNGYGSSNQYRGYGALRAAERGAIAALVRSVTPQSLYTLHAGLKAPPSPGVPDIPVASITVEDAELLYRLQQRGYELKMSLEVNTKYFGTATSTTVIAEIKGSTYPNEAVIFGAHLDTVDAGEGSMDDGGGTSITWQALETLLKLGLRPKRTVRAVFWAAEEFGGVGGMAYYEKHKAESPSISLVMESDTGAFSPLGIHFYGNEAAQEIMQQVMDLLKPINASLLAVDGTVPGDPFQFVVYDNVPGVELFTDAEKYFWYHHSNADMVTAMNSEQLDRCSTVWTTVAYVVADLDSLLPRNSASANFQSLCVGSLLLTFLALSLSCIF